MNSLLDCAPICIGMSFCTSLKKVINGTFIQERDIDYEKECAY